MIYFQQLFDHLGKLPKWLFLNGPTPASFCLFLFTSNKNVYRKNVGFSGIRTWIVGVEGKHKGWGREYSLRTFKGKFHCTADLLLGLSVFSDFVTLKLSTDLLVWLNPNQLNRCSPVQWYFPLQSKWVFSFSWVYFWGKGKVERRWCMLMLMLGVSHYLVPTFE